jgi:hypothetical protein
MKRLFLFFTDLKQITPLTSLRVLYEHFPQLIITQEILCLISNFY